MHIKMHVRLTRVIVRELACCCITENKKRYTGTEEKKEAEPEEVEEAEEVGRRDLE